MNIQELIDQFRTQADDTEEDYLWSDDIVVGFFNDAVREACIRKRLKFDATTEDVCTVNATVADGAVYDLHESVDFVSRASLVNSYGWTVDLKLYSRDELDQINPDWRQDTSDPYALIVDDTSIQIVPDPQQDCVVSLEVYRTPLDEESMVVPEVGDTEGSPAIASLHHPFLHHWALYRAFLRRDVDQYSPQNSAANLDLFEAYFGPRPDANRNRRTRENRPPVTRVW